MFCSVRLDYTRSLGNHDSFNNFVFLYITPIYNKVQWFPRHVSELDLIAARTLDAGIDLQSNHPGFHDPTYRTRREELASISKQYKWNQPIPTIQYTSEETSTWTSVWDSMMPLIEKYACKEYQDALDLMKIQCGYSRNEIPQQSSISTFLKSHCNFVMRPVPGLLSSRDFLNGLAFRYVSLSSL